MSRATRAFVGVGLLGLLGAAGLHLLVLLGYMYVWPTMIHLSLFGWISAIILAVNYHTMPVFSGRAFPYPALLTVHWIAFTGGILLATVGYASALRPLTGAGLALQLSAALLFAVNTMLLFLRGTQRGQRPPAPPLPDQPRIDRLATRATTTAGLCLPIALALLLGVHLEWISGAWLLAAEHLTTLGWIMLMIAGVAYHVLPRFSGRAVRGARWAAAHLACHSIALGLIVLALGLSWPRVFAVGGAMMAVALALFAWTIWPTLVALQPRTTSIALRFKERPQ